MESKQLSPKVDNIPVVRTEPTPKKATEAAAVPEKVTPESGPSVQFSGPVYSKSASYWASVEPTVDGMLGGLGSLSRIDIQSNEKFLKTLFKLPDPPKQFRALDCGAGIGRITKNLLIRFFEHVDIVEQDKKFIEQAKVNLSGQLPKGHVVDNFFCEGLQTFCPAEGYYDIIWIQWVLNYLTDSDLLELLKRCKSALTLHGVLVIKENCTKPTVKSIEPDLDDSSITRPVSNFTRIFNDAGFRIISRYKQKDFPRELFPVWCFALVSI